MKKVLITGPIGGFYGRDIEVNLVAKALQKHYDISFFSTGIWNRNSASIKNITKPKYLSLTKSLLKNPIIFFFTFLSWVINGFKSDFQDHTRNKINKKLINKFEWDTKILNRQLADKDIILCFVQLRSAYLKEIIQISKKYNLKIIVRPTGKITDCPLDINILRKVDLFIHHSESNKNNLLRYFYHNFKIIDQGSAMEHKLLNLKPLERKKGIVFGFLGRLSELKGIEEIINVAKELNIQLVIAGDGEMKNTILSEIQNATNIIYLGKLKYYEIHNFFKMIDIFIINSLHETGPLTGLEAMCASRFIISTKVGAMPERLTENPNLWTNKNLKINIIKTLKMDKQEISLIANRNRDIYKKNYSLKNIQKQYYYALNFNTHAQRYQPS